MMRSLLSIFFLFSFAYANFCWANSQNNPPEWFIKQSLAKEVGVTLGYGQGKTLEEAKSHARADVANQLKVIVGKQFECLAERKNGNFTKNCRQAIQSETRLELTQVKTLQQQQVGKLFYAVVRYDNRTLAERIAQQSKNTPNICKKELASSLKKQTDFSLDLEQNLGCVPSWQLNYRQGAWYVSVANNPYILRKNDLLDFWPSHKSPFLKLVAPSQVKQNTPFFIHLTPKDSGFLSLVSVSQKGETQLLLENQKVKANQKIEFPKRDDYDGLLTEIEANHNSAQDLFLGLLCRKPISMDRLHVISTKRVVKDESVFAFDQLFSLAEQCHISRDIVLTLKES